MYCMKTSSEIYSWILNSQDFKPSNFTISYFDAIKKKYIDVALLKWKPMDREIDPGDIPWTRVYFIKWKNKIVWDREKRFCDLSIAVEEEQILQNKIKIMSFNILSDVYEKHITNMDKRLSEIKSFLENSNADIICLQEVTDKALPDLEKTGYLIHKTDTKTNNVAILSKIAPSHFTTFGLGNIEKQAIMCIYNFENNLKLNVVGIHLTSNTNRNAKSTRTQQINRILQYLSINGEPNSPTIILGDTNEPDRIEQLCKFEDSGNSLIPTYNPEKNKLANKLSDTGGIHRYDRIYSLMLNCLSFNVIENNTISDHYAVIGEYELNPFFESNEEHNLNNIVATNKTSLCLILPHNLQKLLPKYNENWPQHINIFWPFIPEKLFDKYSDLIKNELEKLNFEPFVVNFNNISQLNHEKNTTICYHFDDEIKQNIKQIRKVVSKIVGFPNDEKNIHMSLELCPNDEEIKNKITKKYNSIKIPSYNVNALYLISCENSTEMLIKSMITFKKPSRNDYIQKVIDFLSQFDLKVCLCGSDAFNLESEDSDVDILCMGNFERNDIFDQLYKPIMQCGLFYKCLVVKNDYTYELKLHSDFTTVDIHYVNLSNKADKYYQNSFTLYEDPSLIKTLVKNYETFIQCLKYVRQLLKKNSMYGQQYCYLSGISLAILTGFIVNNYKINTLEEFILTLKNFDFEQIISLDKKTYTRHTKSDQFIVILQPSAPYANTVRNIVRSTKLLLVDCLKNEKLTIKFKNKIIFKVENKYEDDICSNTNMKEIINFTSQILMRFILQIERLNEKHILKPHDDWKFVEKNKAIFIIEHNCNPGEILFHLERTEKNLRELFRGYSFNVITKIID